MSNKQQTMQAVPEHLMKELAKHLDTAYDILHAAKDFDPEKLKEQRNTLQLFIKERADFGWSVPSHITGAVSFANYLLKQAGHDNS